MTRHDERPESVFLIGRGQQRGSSEQRKLGREREGKDSVLRGKESIVSAGEEGRVTRDHMVNLWRESKGKGSTQGRSK